jgi:toxin-antitoxin system PIN domain toxin
LLDVNLLIGLLQPDHVHHSSAHRWWTENGSAGWASCPLTQNGFVRIVSQPRYPKPIPVTRAIALLQEATAATDHAFWPNDISLADPQRFDSERILGPKQLTDIYLLALAVKNGGRLATFDRTIPIAAVRGAEPRHVAVIG